MDSSGSKPQDACIFSGVEGRQCNGQNDHAEHTANDHGHPHHNHFRSASGQNQRRLAWVLVFSGGYMLAEAVGGWLTNSLALLADAAHMASDVAALALSLFAVWIARRPGNSQQTFGYYRAEILAALANGSALIAVSLFIFVEAWNRIFAVPEVLGPAMMAIAVGGLIVNLLSLRILSSGRDASLNIRGAWLHVLTDALGSVGAIAAGAMVWTFGWNWADPVISALIGLLIIYSSWRLLAETVGVLMEHAPQGIDVDQVRNTIARVPGVREVHDLHVWTITSGMDSLCCHVVMQSGQSAGELLRQIRHELHHFGIDHVTIQLEPEGFIEGPVHP